MLVEIVKTKNVIKLILKESIPDYIYDKNNPIELLVIRRLEDRSRYKIIDYRHTNEYTDPTEYLEDSSSLERIRLEKYQNQKNNKFNFFHRIYKNQNDIELISWNNFNGIVFENADKPFHEDLPHQFESYIWSYNSALKKIKEAEKFWTEYTETKLEHAKIKKEHRPCSMDFY